MTYRVSVTIDGITFRPRLSQVDGPLYFTLPAAINVCVMLDRNLQNFHRLWIDEVKGDQVKHYLEWPKKEEK